MDCVACQMLAKYCWVLVPYSVAHERECSVFRPEGT